MANYTFYRLEHFVFFGNETTFMVVLDPGYDNSIYYQKLTSVYSKQFSHFLPEIITVKTRGIVLKIC